MRIKCKAAEWSCEVDLPLSRCRMFQLRPPSVSPVVSGPGPDVNTAPAFVLAQPPQETSPVWSPCIPKHAYPMAIDECRALQSRANISQWPACSGRTSEGGLMFLRSQGWWEWEGLTYMRWVFLSCCSRGLWMKTFYCKISASVLLMDDCSAPPNARPFTEFVDFSCEHVKKFTSRLCRYLC